MKTFRKHFLSAAVILMGIGTAYASHAENKTAKKLAPQDGYIFNHSIGSCEKVAECDSTPGVICTMNGTPASPQAFGLDVPGNLSTCNVELYQRQ
ncbi:hypothetical protein [Chryseobacterium sp. SIMBA_038]|uniref:hypothetical protein n=1 Tax=Chryseobacterium sp. SIMBA_038 TaxID=3085780 RepID=UPI0039797E4D